MAEYEELRKSLDQTAKDIRDLVQAATDVSELERRGQDMEEGLDNVVAEIRRGYPNHPSWSEIERIQRYHKLSLALRKRGLSSLGNDAVSAEISKGWTDLADDPPTEELRRWAREQDRAYRQSVHDHLVPRFDSRLREIQGLVREQFFNSTEILNRAEKLKDELKFLAQELEKTNLVQRSLYRNSADAVDLCIQARQQWDQFANWARSLRLWQRAYRLNTIPGLRGWTQERRDYFEERYWENVGKLQKEFDSYLDSNNPGSLESAGENLEMFGDRDKVRLSSGEIAELKRKYGDAVEKAGGERPYEEDSPEVAEARRLLEGTTSLFIFSDYEGILKAAREAQDVLGGRNPALYRDLEGVIQRAGTRMKEKEDLENAKKEAEDAFQRVEFRRAQEWYSAAKGIEPGDPDVKAASAELEQIVKHSDDAHNSSDAEQYRDAYRHYRAIQTYILPRNIPKLDSLVNHVDMLALRQEAEQTLGEMGQRASQSQGTTTIDSTLSDLERPYRMLRQLGALYQTLPLEPAEQIRFNEWFDTFRRWRDFNLAQVLSTAKDMGGIRPDQAHTYAAWALELFNLDDETSRKGSGLYQGLENLRNTVASKSQEVQGGISNATQAVFNGDYLEAENKYRGVASISRGNPVAQAGLRFMPVLRRATELLNSSTTTFRELHGMLVDFLKIYNEYRFSELRELTGASGPVNTTKQRLLEKWDKLLEIEIQDNIIEWATKKERGLTFEDLRVKVNQLCDDLSSLSEGDRSAGARGRLDFLETLKKSLDKISVLKGEIDTHVHNRDKDQAVASLKSFAEQKFYDLNGNIWLEAWKSRDYVDLETAVNGIPVPLYKRMFKRTWSKVAGAVIGVLIVAGASLGIILSLRSSPPELPPLPQLLAPANGDTDVSLKPLFAWDGNGSSYRVQVSGNGDFNDGGIVASGNTRALSWSLPLPLSLGCNSVYFWRVAAEGPEGESWSPGAGFSTEACATPTPTPTPYPTYTPYPTFTPMPTTSTPYPTYTPYPTFTPVPTTPTLVPPMPTVRVTPTPTPTPTLVPPMPTATATPTPTPTPIPPQGAEVTCTKESPYKTGRLIILVAGSNAWVDIQDLTLKEALLKLDKGRMYYFYSTCPTTINPREYSIDRDEFRLRAFEYEPVWW